ncbi:hypothetical protein GA0115254_101739 [Streptomyces sp. Ncost-T10-10d]|nr:hypothetical protein [Streptomyces sp. Ncost-T10-10d]SCF56771.1 hypothetical protein GA0115254_101739 [Streptomyces sp. Ncost-T10-10d]
MDMIELIRGSDRPCGCFGIADSKPLGTANIVGGLASVAVAVAGLLGPAAAGTAAMTALLCWPTPRPPVAS